MKKKLDWYALGQFMAHVLALFTAVRDVLEPLRVDLRIIPWLVSEQGKPALVECLTALGKKYRKTVRAEYVSERAVLVNLDLPPEVPFEETDIGSAKGEGWVTVELKDGVLHVDDRCVRFAPAESFASPEGDAAQAVFERICALDLLHPNILDTVLDHPYLLPDELCAETAPRRVVAFGAVFFKTRPRKTFVAGGGRSQLLESKLHWRTLVVANGKQTLWTKPSQTLEASSVCCVGPLAGFDIAFLEPAQS